MAAPVVVSSTGLTDPNPTSPSSISTVGQTTTIVYGQNPLSTPTFSGSFVFNNTEAGLYSIVLNTSTTGTSFTTATLSGMVGGVATIYNLFALDAEHMNFKLNPSFLDAGTNYTFAFTGNNSDAAAALSGNVTIRQTPAVPEPGTWAMMLLGFGATGLMMRRRKAPVFAQVA
jgi:hypothetical protein|nr:FxDxF family PEP-CTERM protein [Sphingomonas limnosediminicola]